MQMNLQTDETWFLWPGDVFWPQQEIVVGPDHRFRLTITEELLLFQSKCKIDDRGKTDLLCRLYVFGSWIIWEFLGAALHVRFTPIPLHSFDLSLNAFCYLQEFDFCIFKPAVQVQACLPYMQIGEQELLLSEPWALKSALQDSAGFWTTSKSRPSEILLENLCFNFFKFIINSIQHFVGVLSFFIEF